MEDIGNLELFKEENGRKVRLAEMARVDVALDRKAEVFKRCYKV